MSTFDFLLKLRQSGVKVCLEGGRLRFSGPEQALTAEVREQLGSQKAEIIAFLSAAEGPESGSSSSVIPIQAGGSRQRLFMVPGHNGDVFCYVDMARNLGTDQPFFALQAPGMIPGQMPFSSIEAIAAAFARDLLAVQPQGPYLLGGFCLGGSIAFELAHQLTAQGHQVKLLTLLGSPCPTAFDVRYRGHAAITNITRRLVRHGTALAKTRPGKWSQYLQDRAALRRADRERERLDPLRLQLMSRTVDAFKAYRPKPGKFPVYMLLPNDDPDSLLEDRPLDWGLFTEDFAVQLGPAEADMNTMLLEPHVRVFAEVLDRKLREVTSRDANPAFGSEI